MHYHNDTEALVTRKKPNRICKPAPRKEDRPKTPGKRTIYNAGSKYLVEHECMGHTDPVVWKVVRGQKNPGCPKCGRCKDE